MIASMNASMSALMNNECSPSVSASMSALMSARVNALMRAPSMRMHRLMSLTFAEVGLQGRRQTPGKRSHAARGLGWLS